MSLYIVKKVYAPQDGQIQVHQSRMAQNYLLVSIGTGRGVPVLTDRQDRLTDFCREQLPLLPVVQNQMQLDPNQC